MDRADYVAKLFTEIEDRWVGASQDAANFRQDLRAFGSALFDELVPPEIQEAMWEHRDRITAIQVLSTEPFIPWEIVHLKEPGGSLGQEEHFLGSKGLVRWLHGSWPPSEIRVRPDRVRAVIPAYPEGTNYQLPEAEAEMGFLTEEFGAIAVEPTTQKVRELISQPGSFDLLHFAGHGTADQGDVGKARLMMQGRVENNAYVPEYLNATTVSEFGRPLGRRREPADRGPQRLPGRPDRLSTDQYRWIRGGLHQGWGGGFRLVALVGRRSAGPDLHRDLVSRTPGRKDRDRRHHRRPTGSGQRQRRHLAGVHGVRPPPRRDRPRLILARNSRTLSPLEGPIIGWIIPADRP